MAIYIREMRKKMLRAPACLCASGAIAVVSSLRRNTSWTTWPRRTSSRGRAAMTSPASGRSVRTIVRLLFKTVNISSLSSCSAKSVCRTILILKDKIQNFHLQIANVSKSDSSLVTEKQLPTIIVPGVSTTIEAVQREVQAAHPHEGSHWREALRLQGESNPSFFITDKWQCYARGSSDGFKGVPNPCRTAHWNLTPGFLLKSELSS